MTLEDIQQLPDSTISVEVTNPDYPFGGVQVIGSADSTIQVEFNTGNPVGSVFGRVGNITAQCGDYAACYAPIGEGGDGGDLPIGGEFYFGTDLRVVTMAGGGKLQARDPGTNLWADVDQWTNP